jgi:hypothetical protein
MLCRTQLNNDVRATSGNTIIVIKSHLWQQKSFGEQQTNRGF